MDRSRWPDAIATFADGVTCPQCGAPRRRVMVTVRYQNPVWHVLCNCMNCNQIHDTQHVDMYGTLRPKPELEEVPLPAWVKDL